MGNQEEIVRTVEGIRRDWEIEIEDSVIADPEQADPHDKESGDSDYAIFYVDRSASAEQEAIFQQRVAEAIENLTKADAAAMTAAGTPEAPSPLFFTVDDKGNVLELIKDEDDSLSIRLDGEWVDISDEDEFPTVYEQVLKPATDDSVGAWDADLEDNQELKLEDIGDYIVE